IEVLRGGRVLASHKHSPGAWTATLKFAPGSFQYKGDGSGDVRLRIKSAGPQTSGRFHGAIDNVIVRKVEAKKEQAEQANPRGAFRLDGALRRGEGRGTRSVVRGTEVFGAFSEVAAVAGSRGRRLVFLPFL